MSITKTTAAAVALFGVLVTMPMSGIAQSSSTTNVAETCIANCAKLGEAQMTQKRTHSHSQTQTNADGSGSSTTTESGSSPAYSPSAVFNNFGECISNCIQASQ